MGIIKYLLLTGLIATAAQAETPRLLPEHQAMLQAIEESVLRTASYTGKSQLSQQVMQRMAEVPRHEFVPGQYQQQAYLNSPLRIGHGQTISQPLIVALMTDFLEPAPEHVILEVGTGSGYQAAVLAGLVAQVYSIEIIPALAESAKKTLHRLGYENIEVRTGDGYLGWPEHQPFDSIIVTAAAPHVPPPLLEQLKSGGLLVIPVERERGNQELLVIVKRQDGSTEQRSVLPVRFVPLTGDH